MKRLTNLLAEAGFVRTNPWLALAGSVTIALLLAAWASVLMHVLALGLFAAAATLGFAVELLKSKARARQRALAATWPSVVEVLLSGALSSVDLGESIFELATHAPTRIRSHFAVAHNKLESGFPMPVVLTELKLDLSMRYSDATLEMLLLSLDVGAQSLPSALRDQAIQIREDLALWGEIESKQGWVMATAKIALVAPWVIVAMLSSRPENAAVYNSISGLGILLVGLVVSIMAYRLIHFLGALPSAPRVLSGLISEATP